jgi:hypothetical protein
LPAKIQLAGEAARLMPGKICELSTEFTKSNSVFPRALPWAGIYQRLRRFGEKFVFTFREGIKTVPLLNPKWI